MASNGTPIKDDAPGALFLCRLQRAVEVVILTVNEKEYLAALDILGPLNTGDIQRVNHQSSSYCVGTIGSYTVAVARSRMGSIGRDASIVTTLRALAFWRPRAVIMVGVAFGADEQKQRLGDVLVASQIISYEPARLGEKTVGRGPHVEPGAVLQDRFRHAESWQFQSSLGAARAIEGPILSGEKLVANETDRAELLGRYPQAVGGEMEGAGLYAGAEQSKTEWILVKGICDWASLKKGEEAQSAAAAAACSLVKHVLSRGQPLAAIPSHKDSWMVQAAVGILLVAVAIVATTWFVLYDPIGGMSASHAEVCGNGFRVPSCSSKAPIHPLMESLQSIGRLSMADPNECVRVLSAVILEQTYMADAYYMRGICQDKLGNKQAKLDDWRQALKLAERAILLAPNNPCSYATAAFIESDGTAEEVERSRSRFVHALFLCGGNRGNLRETLSPTIDAHWSAYPELLTFYKYVLDANRNNR